jgi:hypothetical protein
MKLFTNYKSIEKHLQTVTYPRSIRFGSGSKTFDTLIPKDYIQAINICDNFFYLNGNHGWAEVLNDQV